MTNYTALNIHPNWRKLGLGHINGLRQLIRFGHPMYASEARDLIKQAQRRLLRTRQRILNS